jgi:tRNA threonylcarbamoyl adenosine modification protein YeaZ
MDSATPAITAAAVEIASDGAVTVLAERATVDARAHGELLAPAISEVLTQVGKTPADLSAIVAGVGPGPFTGLRVGLVTAATMADTLGIPAYGVCTLDAIGSGTTGPVLVATDARRREVYWAVYQDGERVTDPAVSKPADLHKELHKELQEGLREDLQRNGTAVGAGAHMYADVIGLPVHELPRYPDGASLARCAAERIVRRAPTEPLTPLYLRRPDAVEPGARKPVS